MMGARYHGKNQKTTMRQPTGHNKEPQEVANRDCRIEHGIRLTNAKVVNFLYQGLVDVVSLLEGVGYNGKFDKHGKLEPPDALGEVSIFWGTHIGAVRQQCRPSKGNFPWSLIM